MALPTTRDALLDWVIDVVLQGTAAALEWDPGSPPVVNVVDEVELILGHTIETDDAPRVMLALTRREAWRAAVAGTADRFRVSSDNQVVDLQMVHKHAVDMLTRAESDYEVALAAAGLSADRGAVVTSVTYADPYAYLVEVDDYA